MDRDSDRLAPWTGIAFVVLAVAGAITAGNSPDAKSSGTQVLSFYGSHHTRSELSAILLTFSFIALVFFAAALRTYFRHAGANGLGSALVAGAAILAAGQTINEGFVWALAQNATRLSTVSAQTLNVAQNDAVLTSAAGWFIFAVVAWLAILRTHSLPVWLGWVSLVIGLVVVTPVEVAGFFLFLIWMAIVSVMTARRWSTKESLDARNSAL